MNRYLIDYFFPFNGKTVQMIVAIDASNCLAGGGLTHLIELLRAFKNQESNVERLIIWGSKATLKELPSSSKITLRNHHWLEKNYFWKFCWQKFVLGRECIKDDCDILFLPGGLYLGSFRPFVTMHQNSLPFSPDERARFGLSRTRLRYHVLEWLQKFTFQRSSCTIYLTNHAKELVEKRIGHRKNLDPVIYHGVSTKFQCAAKTQYPPKYYSSSKPFRFLYVSIVNFYKHQWNIVEAVGRLRSRGYPISLDLVGPSYPAALKVLKKSMDKIDSSSEFIRYHGKISYEKIEGVYKEADSFIWASSCEAFGMILLEAMSASLPIACSKRSCSPELLQNFGWYFDPEDIRSIENALIDLFENPKKRGQLIRGAYKRSKEFNWQHCSNSTIECLATTLEAHQFS